MSDELLALNQQMLDSISDGDWATYESLCDPTLSAFEPEARGQLVEGMDFHRYYFDFHQSVGPTSTGPKNTTVTSPHVRRLGDDVAVISYVRLVQHVGDAGRPVTSRFEETRVWQRQDGAWRHVHFHRSMNE